MHPQVMLREDGSKVYLVHFLHRAQRGILQGDEKSLLHDGDLVWVIACAPSVLEMARRRQIVSYQRTEDPRAVTCPLCKKTPQFTIAASHQPAGAE